MTTLSIPGSQVTPVGATVCIATHFDANTTQRVTGVFEGVSQDRFIGGPVLVIRTGRSSQELVRCDKPAEITVVDAPVSAPLLDDRTIGANAPVIINTQINPGLDCEIEGQLIGASTTEEGVIQIVLSQGPARYREVRCDRPVKIAAA